MRITDRRVGRDLTTNEASILADSINEKVKLKNADFKFKNTFGHRGVLVISWREGPLSDQITNTDPAYERIKNLCVAKPESDFFLRKSQPMNTTNNHSKIDTITHGILDNKHQFLLQLFQVFQWLCLAEKVCYWYENQ